MSLSENQLEKKVKLLEHDKAKYILADILPNCGECRYFYRVLKFKDETHNLCKLYGVETEFFEEACHYFSHKTKEMICN